MMNKNDENIIQPFAYSDLELLAMRRFIAREDELDAKRIAARVEADLNALKADVILAGYREGAINGRNAEERKRQEEVLITSSPTFAEEIVRLHRSEDDLDDAQAEREHMDDLVSLTKAWLYSQSGER